VKRTVLVVGGNRGIGRSVAQAFARSGDRVAVTFRSGEPPRLGFGVRCEVTDQASIDGAYDEVEAALGPVQVVVVNAGIDANAPIEEMSDRQWDDVIATNLTGAFRVARRAVRSMPDGGRIILLSSIVGLRGAIGQANYAAAKSGLNGLARALARELGPRRITVNAVAPGFTETDWTAGISEKERTEFLELVPLQRTASPEEIAEPILFLASEGASYITGTILRVDGGAAMGH